MSSPSAAMPTGSGAPNATFGRASVPGPVTPAARSRSIAAPTRPRRRAACSGGASADRGRATAASAAVGSGAAGTRRLGGRGSTSGSLRHDERARPSRFGRRDGHQRSERLGRLAATPAVRREAGPDGTRRGSRPSRRASASCWCAAIVVGLLLWMARDSVRPFIVGLLLVYLLDIPVRWLAAPRPPADARDPHRVRRRDRDPSSSSWR